MNGAGDTRGKTDGFWKPFGLLWRVRIRLFAGGIRNGNEQPVGLRPMKSPSGEGLGWLLFLPGFGFALTH